MWPRMKEGQTLFLEAKNLRNVLECRRTKGDIARFDPLTDEYGVIDNSRTIRTYFMPVPCNNIPVTIRIMMQKSKRCHTDADNTSYFHTQCAKQ